MNHPPKICIFTETFFPVVGGGEIQANALAMKLREFGHNVIVVTRRSQVTSEKRESFGYAVVYRLAPAGKDHYKKWGLLITSVPALIRLRNQYDVILVSGFRVIGIPAVLVSKILGKVCILKADSLGEMSGAFFQPGLMRLHVPFLRPLFALFLKVRNSILRRADGFIAISIAIGEELTAQNVSPYLVHSIPNSVDPDEFFPVDLRRKCELRNKLGINQNDKIVTYTGRLVTYKGLQGLLEVWQRVSLHRKNIKLLLLGSGGNDIHNCESELKAYVDVSKMNDRVCFVGEVGNVSEYLQASDIFIFPSENESFGIALVEAMSCGLPVISTYAGGLRDILEDHRNGLVIEQGNRAQLMSALEELLDNPDLAIKLGKAARQSVQQLYSVDIVTRQYQGCIDRLVQNKKRSVEIHD